jgi:hypothetical protein
MKNTHSYYPLLILFFVFIVFSSCKIDKNQHTDFLSFEDFACYLSNKVTDISNSDDFLYDWQLVGNLLNLDFRFDAVCLSAYSNNVITENNSIHIFLEDTASVHARCTCPHRSIFRFSLGDVDYIKLILDIKFYGSDDFTTCVDTLLQLH